MKGKLAVYTKKYKALHKQECDFLFFRKAIKLNKIKSNLKKDNADTKEKK